MDHNMKIERTTVDGRRAETHVQEQVSDGTTNRVTTHFEEIIPYEMKKRVTERVVPVVLERHTEEFNGSNVLKTVEKVADDYTRLTGLTPVQPSCVTKEDVEAAVKKALEETKGFSFKLPSVPRLLKTAPTQDAPDNVIPQDTNNTIIGYALITLLAVEVGRLVWQLFIR